MKDIFNLIFFVFESGFFTGLCLMNIEHKNHKKIEDVLRNIAPVKKQNIENSILEFCFDDFPGLKGCSAGIVQQNGGIIFYFKGNPHGYDKHNYEILQNLFQKIIQQEKAENVLSAKTNLNDTLDYIEKICNSDKIFSLSVKYENFFNFDKFYSSKSILKEISKKNIYFECITKLNLNSTFNLDIDFKDNLISPICWSMEDYEQILNKLGTVIIKNKKYSVIECDVGYFFIFYLQKEIHFAKKQENSSYHEKSRFKKRIKENF